MPFLAEKKESASALHLAIVPSVNEYSFKFSHIQFIFSICREGSVEPWKPSA